MIYIFGDNLSEGLDIADKLNLTHSEFDFWSNDFVLEVFVKGYLEHSRFNEHHKIIISDPSSLVPFEREITFGPFGKKTIREGLQNSLIIHAED